MTLRAASFLTVILPLGACLVDDDRGLTRPDAGLSEPDAAATVDEHCNPFDEQACLLPWPSSAYLEADDATDTGLRVALPAEAMPANGRGETIDPTPYNRRDGFPATGVILASFPSGVASDGLPPIDDIGASLAEDSPIVLLNMDTGTRHPFFAEVDANPFNTAPRRALIIRPMERLAPGARYAVGIRDAVKAPDGDALPMSAAFRAARDGAPLGHPLAERVAAHYEDVFEALEEAGVDRLELRLAWDFVTASDASVTSDLLSMRDQASDLLSEVGASLRYELETIEFASDNVHMWLEGTYEAPNFLTDGAEDDSVLIRDDDGLPLLDGLYDAELTAVIPRCVTTAELPVPVVIFGHGLMASASEHLAYNRVLEAAEESCRVFIGSDWIGLSRRQITLGPQAAADANRVLWIAEKLAQAVINFIALEHTIRGPLAGAEEFAYEGEPMLDGDDIGYIGVSLGGIMGGVLMAYDEHIERGVLGVPGGPWGLLLERSFYWNAFQAPLINAYGNQLNYQIVQALMNMILEAYDPLTTAPRLLDDPIGGAPPKQIFLYQAAGDSVVANVATETLARTLGLPVTTPSVATPWGLELADAPAPSALTIYDQAPAPLPPTSNLPPEEDNSTHLTVNFLRAPFEQARRFLEDGLVYNECSTDGEPAACDCTTGACD